MRRSTVLLLLGMAAAHTLAVEGAVSCTGRCGDAFVTDPASGAVRGCDYFCDQRGTCCGGAAAKAAACPNMAPTLNKRQLTNCRARVGAAANSSGQAYRPGMCWCDRFCRAANDCCATCPASSASCRPNASGVQLAASAADGVLADAEEQQLTAAVAADALHAASMHQHSSDCGRPDRATRVQQLLSAAGAVSAAAAQQAQQALFNSELETEALMQACQAADKGPPAKPLVARIHWTAARVCESEGKCFGADYSKALVLRQMAYLNAVYARHGIRFAWDGRIHNATAADASEIEFAPYEGSWLCQQRRHGSSADINVVTTPSHVGGIALGVTGLPSWFVAQDMAFPACGNWIVLYDKTMPGQGGRSTVDGQLADSGYVLAHEVGHALMLLHTFAEKRAWTTAEQCRDAASLDPEAVVNEHSDGVVDTPAQIANASTPAGGMNILRFIRCDEQTGAYTNTSANAQQSCNTAAGFPDGEKFYNNYNNMMSYGDKTCLRTLTPGQGARARCGLKCMRRRQC